MINHSFQSLKSQFVQKVFKQSWWMAFLAFSGIYILLTLFSNNYIFTKELYYQNFSDRTTFQSIQDFIQMRNKLWWLNFLIQPLFVLLKVTFATICVSISAMLSNIEFELKTVFKAVLFAESVFIVVHILFLINLYLHIETIMIENISSYYPLTLLSFYGIENVVQWLHYPLKTLNIFEILYAIAIAYFASIQWKLNFTETFAIVAPSYLTGLILWIMLVIFLTLN
jgi:hypothetical protein